MLVDRTAVLVVRIVVLVVRIVVLPAVVRIAAAHRVGAVVLGLFAEWHQYHQAVVLVADQPGVGPPEVVAVQPETPLVVGPPGAVVVPR